jgi:homoserine O-acetyltransferase
MNLFSKWAAGLALAIALAGPAAAAPQVTQADFTMRDFHFRSGETMPELRIHYRTLGQPHRNARGEIDNAVMILHGTGGTGAQFLRPQFGDVLFAPGGELDAAKYFIILPDNIGHGGSSKPSDGLRARFPHYDYDDMVEAQHALLVDGLHVNSLRLIFGTSMGCVHAFVWGETYPGFARALMPMACEPTQIAGRNRLWRKLVMDAITSDPGYNGGDYATQPVAGLRAAQSLLMLAGSAPMAMQATYGARDAVDKYAEEAVPKAVANLDANDLLYQVASSRNYDPSARLELITVPVTWVNSADDFINPPELGLSEQFVPRLKDVRYKLIPNSPDGHGHGTHTWASFWRDDLRELLERSE